MWKNECTSNNVQKDKEKILPQRRAEARRGFFREATRNVVTMLTGYGAYRQGFDLHKERLSEKFSVRLCVPLR
jgi:hypothetical protein